VKDPRGEALQLESKEPADLTRFLEDKRPFVQDRALELLVAAGPAAIQSLAGVRQLSLSEDVRSKAVWGLFRIGTPEAENQVRAALHDASFIVRIAAATAVGMAKDREAVERLMEMVKQDQPAARRQAATALGQIGDDRAIPALLAASVRADERFIDAALRLSCAQALSRSHMTDAQLIRVAQRYLPHVDALVLASLLDGFRATKSEAVGQAMISGLLKSQVFNW